MRIKHNEFLALVYADLFDFPLTLKEAGFWGVGGEGQVREVQIKDRFVFLKGRGKIVELRKKREKISAAKLLKLLKFLKLLKEIDTIEAIFLTGSVAVFNAKENSDIDLMIVTKPGQLWLTRLKILRLLKRLKLDRNKNHIKDRICTNIFLDSNHLEIQDKNLYTAHEVLQAKCVLDRGGVNYRWLQANIWTKEYLPNAYKVAGKGTEKTSLRIWGLLSPLELLAYFLQFAYMRKKITNERIGWGHAFFHPRDLSSETIMRYQQRIRKYLA